MTSNDQQLDQSLADADRSLIPQPTPLAGSDIRRRARILAEVRRDRRQALAGAMVVILLVCGWRYLMPAQQGQPIVEVDSVNNPETNVTRLLAEIEELRQSSQQIDRQLAMLTLERRLTRLNHGLKRCSRRYHSPEVTYQRNVNTWMTLQSMNYAENGKVTESERWRLELLAHGFPDTVAGSVAKTMLTTNQVPEPLWENHNEL